MGELRRDMEELRRRLGEGAIQQAYTAIVAYMSGLRGRLQTAHDEWSVAGLYQGHFDMTYFGLSVPLLRARDLKLAVVFDYPSFRFQVWLAGRNRAVQRRYWELLRDNGWPTATLVEPAVGVDAIVVADVADGLALVDQEALSASIERAVASLLGDLEHFFDRHDPAAV